jgi:hypothetical protein
MCGRYEAGQKQKIAEAFHVSVTWTIPTSAQTSSAPLAPFNRYLHEGR